MTLTFVLDDLVGHDSSHYSDVRLINGDVFDDCVNCDVHHGVSKVCPKVLFL